MEYFNQITNEIDKYKLYSNKPYCFNTYLYQWKEDNFNTWCIRFPGATRGHIKVDDNYIITDIQFYDNTSFGESLACYKNEVVEAVKKFIGTKLELNTTK